MRLKFFFVFAAISAALAAAEPAKYIFYFIGDGMGPGPVAAAETYLRQAGADSTLTMTRMPFQGWATNMSADSPVTDSAAAGTALATGSKTRNGMLGVDPDTVAVSSVARRLKDMGYGIGLVTSVAPDDATPAAFYAHVPHRSHYYDIGCQMAASGYDFIAGAGLRGLRDKQGQATDLSARLAEAGWHTLRGRKGLDSLADAGARVLLLNPEGTPDWNIGYTIDSIAGDRLDLPTMTRACLEHLTARSPDRFFMMVEGGNIDHALHANDAGTAIKELLNFDSALAMAYSFYLQHPDETLIIVTADHDTGGLAMGSNGLPYNVRTANFDYQRISKEAFNEECKAMLRSRRNINWDDMRDYLSEKLGLFNDITLSPENEARLQQLFNETFALRNSADQKTLYANFNAFAVEVYRLLADASGFGFTTTHHTGNFVPVFAVGKGADALTGHLDNTDLPRFIMGDGIR